MLSMPYDTNVWYHVTSELNLQSIRDHGLTPTGRGIANKNFPRHSVAENGVYLASTIATAQEWSFNESSLAKSEGYPGGDPVILKITGLDLQKIIPDPEELNQFLAVRVSDAYDGTVEGWEEAYVDIREAGFPEFFVEWGINGNKAPEAPQNAESFFYWMENDTSGGILFDEIMKMSRQQRSDLTELWKELRSNGAFVYLGVIPAQNISIASYYPAGTEPSPNSVNTIAYDDYEDEFTQYEDGTPRYKYQPMFSKKAMAMRPEDLQEWIEQNGPYAYHDTSYESLEGILKNGLMPWDEIPNSRVEEKYIDDGLAHVIPRAGFVYMHVKDISPHFHGDGVRLTIDLRKLEASRFSADEDYVEDEYLKNPNNEMFDGIRSYPTSHPEWWPESGPESLGAWAEENAEILDDPDVTQKSLQHNKTLAYWGTVPLEAIADIVLPVVLDAWGRPLTGDELDKLFLGPAR